MKKILSLFDEKLVKFVIVGIINTVVGSAIMFGLYNLAHLSYWLSSGLNYFLTSILSFFLNCRFTFRYKDPTLKTVLKFALNIVICYFLAYGCAKPLVIKLLADSSETVRDNLSMAIGMVLFTGFNYLGQRLFAFKKDKN